MNEPDPGDVDAYVQELRALHAAGVEFCLFGSLGLLLGGLDLGDYHVPDADVVLPDDLENLSAAAETLMRRGWACTIWELPVGLPLTDKQIRGKYYIRARRAEQTIDLTYELDGPPRFAEWMAGASLRRGVPTADIAMIAECKRRLGRTRDLTLLKRLKM